MPLKRTTRKSWKRLPVLTMGDTIRRWKCGTSNNSRMSRLNSSRPRRKPKKFGEDS